MRRGAGSVAAVSLLIGSCALAAAAGGARAERAPKKGICVLLGDRECARALALARETELLLYVQLADANDVAAARRAAEEAGFCGTRIFVERGTPARIALADNVADSLYAPAGGVERQEALRVVRPEGEVVIGGESLVKPFPAGMDDWSHPYHLPDNNPQSADTLARAPYLTQFLAAPYYDPLPQVTVSSAGRVFRALGHIAFKPREEPDMNALIAYNGFNGTELWRRPITPGIMVHRNTLIATPTRVYMGDAKSCKVLDAATGELCDEIVPPEDLAGGTFWKWMALERGVLYALTGAQELIDPEVRRSNANNHGWPWDPLSKGYNLPENPWGFGNDLLAIDVATKKVLWHYREAGAIDSRGLCMRNGRIFAFRFGTFLTCVDAADGHVVWRKSADKDAEFFRALGKNLNRQDWRTNFRTAAYLKASDKALYFAGPMVDKLIALSADDGRILWQYPYDNFQLVLREDAVFGIGGGIWTDKTSRMFDPLTGKVLAEIPIGRRACTRPTGTADAVFFRADGGSVRVDVATHRPQYVSPMRPTCFDGVTVANGLLYWWPYACDCQQSLVGATCLGPAGAYRFGEPAREAERLERADGWETVKPLACDACDWPSFRANAKSGARTLAEIPAKADLAWEAATQRAVTPTAPIACGDTVYVAGSDGIVRALDAATGAVRWKAYTGGGIKIAPTVWEGRLYAGSGDGRVYALEAATGRLLWTFRAAPEDRRIPVYGALASTWPAASGVLVEDGTAYVAAGIANYDGTHVYALDARSGAIKWQNNSSGHLNAEARCGVGVQGQLLLHGGRLYLAGGNAVSPGAYDAKDGRCLNNGDDLNVCESICLRGWELYLVGDKVAVSGQPFYGSPDFPVIDATCFAKALHVPAGERDIVWLNNIDVRCYRPIAKELLDKCVLDRKYPGNHIIAAWGKFEPGQVPVWARRCEGSVGIAVGKNAVAVATATQVLALNIADGTQLWSCPLAAPPVPWGIALDRRGSVLVACKDGRVRCFGGK